MINDRIVTLFMSHIAQKLDQQFQLPTLYDDPFIFEDADPPFSIAETPTTQPQPQKEYIAYPTEKIYKHPKFQHFMKQNHLANSKHTLFLKEAKLLEHIKVTHLNLHMPFHKTIVKINGDVLDNPNRDYSLNFINDKEWVFHVYDKSNKTLLHYFFTPVSNLPT